MSENVNLQSSDAYFAVILQRLEAQDKRAEDDRIATEAFRKELAAKIEGHSSRISLLESDRNRVLGFAAGAGAAGGGIGAWFHKLFS